MHISSKRDRGLNPSEETERTKKGKLKSSSSDRTVTLEQKQLPESSAISSQTSKMTLAERKNISNLSEKQKLQELVLNKAKKINAF